MYRSYLVWVEISHVKPNKLNPRKDNSRETEQIQDILQSKGWEEGLTGYQDTDGSYILLSGHRRLHAAKELGYETVPVYVVERPENQQEEVERIADLQSAHVEWTRYEWAKFAYESWIHWGRPPFKDFKKIIHMNEDTLQRYIEVFEYFPQPTLEKYVEGGKASFDSFISLKRWMSRFQLNRPELFNRLSKDMVMDSVIDKLIHKRAKNKALYNDDFIVVADDSQVMDFLKNRKKTLSEAQLEVGTETGILSKNKKIEKRLGNIIRDVPYIKPKDQKEEKYLRQVVHELEEKISLAKKRIEQSKGGEINHG
ncbi:ParB N-terminal domain-containing protein [Halobacillus locisalis]|uniref:ParB N-terminal domain-containing protein n=1 Tax=Halobacillus locisalis TaxID=220753 RepID=A0A838CTI2_9BACI|nr:ParB/RepB/Spo0J family partition protein [Halobacillus locisalis]MBA2175377.1 ParB N-terminal domain-containing protein [Halobacillus locisalis]